MVGYGQWSWVYVCDEEPDRSTPAPGWHGRALCLPSEFSKRLREDGLLERVNRRFGCLLDYYEEEDLVSPIALAFMAAGLDSAFRGHELEALVADLVSFLLRAAAEEKCVTFWL